MAQIQLDTRNGFAPTLVPYLLDVDPGSRYYAGGQRLLARVGLHPARRLGRGGVLQRGLEEPAPAHLRRPAARRRRAVRGRRPVVRGGAPACSSSRTSPWWDDVRHRRRPRGARRHPPPGAARRPRRARAAAVAPGRRGGRWGHQHTLTLENQTVGQSDIGLGRAPRQPGAVGARAAAPRSSTRSAGTPPRATRSNWVPSMRMVVSMADLDASTLGEPHRGERPRVQRPLHRPDRAVGARDGPAAVAVQPRRRSRTRPRRRSRLKPGSRVTPPGSTTARHRPVVAARPAPGRRSSPS